jgi:hypothetical protein
LARGSFALDGDTTTSITYPDINVLFFNTRKFSFYDVFVSFLCYINWRMYGSRRTEEGVFKK